MNISIFAAIWAQNLWDELILKNEINLLRWEFWDEAQFRVASYDAENPVFDIQNTSYFEYFPLWLKKPKNILRNIRNFLKFVRVVAWSNIVVIGGGWIIYDSELQSVNNPLNQWIFRVKIARFFRKKIYFYAIWIDIKQQKNKDKLQKIFSKAYKIKVRDAKSGEQLQELWIGSEVVDDPVMSEYVEKWKMLWKHSSKSFKLKVFESYDFQWKKVWLALRSWYIGASGDSRVEKLLVEELCNFIESRWWEIVFLPHSIHPTDEKADDYRFMSNFLTRNRSIEKSLWDVYRVYQNKEIDIMISMRLHSIILSYVYGIDQIVLSYSQKTDEAIKKLS